MLNSLINLLKRATQAALNSSSSEHIKHISSAVSLILHEAKRLHIAHLRLQERFKLVNSELDKINSEMHSKTNQFNANLRYLNTILKNISQGIIFIDKEGIITTFNDAACKILEIDQKTALFSSYFSIFSNDHFGFSLRSAIDFGFSPNLSYLNLKTKNHETKQIEIFANYINNCEKSYQGLLLILTDTTDIKKMQTVINRSERLKELGEMTATIIHNIKNPLGGIRGYASLLCRDLQDTAHLQEMASYIVDGTKRLERLINNLLTFAKPIEPKLEFCDISQIIKELCNHIKVDSSHNNKIYIHLSENKLTIPCDKLLISSAILNILINAIQATENGEITVSLLKNNNNCVINISATGEGISKNDLENIFSPHFTTKDTGNGLGLTEAYRTIKAHQGSIEVRSEINKGTTFTITIPIKR